jgi:hypothetical protein
MLRASTCNDSRQRDAETNTIRGMESDSYLSPLFPRAFAKAVARRTALGVTVRFMLRSSRFLFFRAHLIDLRLFFATCFSHESQRG